MLRLNKNNQESLSGVSSSGIKDVHVVTKTDDQKNFSFTQYKRFTPLQTRRNCYCPACIDSDFKYINDFLLKDDDPAIFQLFGKELVK